MRVKPRTLPKDPAAFYGRDTTKMLAIEFQSFLKSASREEQRFLLESFVRRDTNSGSDLPIAAAVIAHTMSDELLVVDGIHFRELQEQAKLAAKITPIKKRRAS